MSIESTQRAEEEAADWLLRRDGSEWTAADAARLQQWLDESIENYVAFIRLEAGWEQVYRLKALGTGVAKGVVPPAGQWQVSPFFDAGRGSVAEEKVATGRPARTRWIAVAASVLVAVGATAYYFIAHSAGDRYSTPLGVIAAVPIADGSRVTLNTASEIRVAVTDTERKVQLARGEAYFEVAKDPRRPFVVDAGSKRIVAVGTAFSVRREGDEVEVVVTEGVVRVEAAKPSQRAQAGATAARLDRLAAGNVVRANAEGLLVEKKALADLQEQLAWRAGYLVFNETPLRDAVAQFNRYSTTKIVIEDPAVAAYRVSGKFRSTSFEAFVRLLENAFPIDVRHEDERIGLSARDHFDER